MRSVVGPGTGVPVPRESVEALIQMLFEQMFHWLLDAGEIIQRVVERDSPSRSLRFIDHLVGYLIVL